jgi:CHAT domain-containing protein
MDSLLEDRALAKTFAKDKDTVQPLRELRSLQNRLSRLSFTQDKTNESAGIIEQISAIQRKMANRTHVFGRVRASADLTLDSILPALSGGAMFVDFLEFSDPKLTGDAKLHYGASLLTEDGNPIFIRIPDRVGIDRAVDAVHSSLLKGDENLLISSLSELSEKLWKPIGEKVPSSINRLIICPDGKLNFVSFASLLDSEKKFVCEKYMLNYVATARDSPSGVSRSPRKSIAIFANPTFDTNSAEVLSEHLTMRSSEISAFGKVKLPPLPGTATECTTLSKMGTSQGWATNTFVGKEATEKQIRSIKDTGILHLATHGFYLQSTSPFQEASRAIRLEGSDTNAQPLAKPERKVNPMRASGIALAGAQSTFKSWKEGVTPDPENDGILMAEEVACLNLEETWLVSLSACETGVGEARSGEGVFGLRRAFMMAGAQNLLMTLWPVSDTTTTDIMADFYRRFLSSGNPARALAETQRDWLLKLKQEKGLLAAIRDAGAFVMSSPGIKTSNLETASKIRE